MKAAYYEEFGPPDVLQVGELPTPELKDGGVLIDVRAASVIPGDWRLRSGELKDLFPVTFPKVPGNLQRRAADGAAAAMNQDAGSLADFAALETDPGADAGVHQRRPFRK